MLLECFVSVGIVTCGSGDRRDDFHRTAHARNARIRIAVWALGVVRRSSR